MDAFYGTHANDSDEYSKVISDFHMERLEKLLK